MLTSYELDVAAPANIVFATAADVGAMSQFTRDVESMEFLTPTPLQQGSRVRDTRRLLGVRRSQVIAIPLYDPPTRFIARFAIFGVTFESDHLFFDKDGHTRFRVTVNVAGASGLGHVIRPFVPFVASIVRYGIRREIEDIKIEAERRVTKG